MDQDDDISKIKAFSEKRQDIAISYGGDGEILKIWRKAVSDGKTICPVRNYGRCGDHADPFSGIDFGSVDSRGIVSCRRMIRDGVSFKYDALSEIQIKSADVTSALRMDLYVNGRRFFENVIADGIICSTPFGATGYFSSVARTLFSSGIGLAFIAPTIGVNNLVLQNGEKIDVELRRSADVILAADKETERFGMKQGQTLTFFIDPDKTAKFVGLDVFHCPECRNRRHGTTFVNQYLK